MQDPVEQPWVKNDQPGVPAAGGRPWKELLSNGRIDPAYPRPQVQDLEVLGYTSGTTGRPKAQLRKAQLRKASHLKAHSHCRQGKGCFTALLQVLHQRCYEPTRTCCSTVGISLWRAAGCVPQTWSWSTHQDVVAVALRA